MPSRSFTRHERLSGAVSTFTSGNARAIAALRLVGVELLDPNRKVPHSAAQLRVGAGAIEADPAGAAGQHHAENPVL